MNVKLLLPLFFLFLVFSCQKEEIAINENLNAENSEIQNLINQISDDNIIIETYKHIEFQKEKIINYSLDYNLQETLQEIQELESLNKTEELKIIASQIFGFDNLSQYRSYLKFFKESIDNLNIYLAENRTNYISELEDIIYSSYRPLCLDELVCERDYHQGLLSCPISIAGVVCAIGEGVELIECMNNAECPE